MDKMFKVGTRIKGKVALWYIDSEEFNYNEFLSMIQNSEPKKDIKYILVRVV